MYRYVLFATLLVAAVTSSGCAGTQSNGKYRNAESQVAICNQSIARLLRESPPAPSLDVYRSDAYTTLACLKTMEIARGKRQRAVEAKHRARLVKNASDSELRSLLTRPPFLSYEANIKRLEEQLATYHQLLRNQLALLSADNRRSESEVAELLRKIEVLERKLEYFDRYDLLPSPAGPFMVHEDGV